MTDYVAELLKKEPEEATPKGINFNSEWLDDFVKMVEKLKEN